MLTEYIDFSTFRIFFALRDEVLHLREQCGDLEKKLLRSVEAQQEAQSAPEPAESEHMAKLTDRVDDLTKANDILVKEVFKHREESAMARRKFQSKNLQINHKLTVAEEELERVKVLRKEENRSLSKSLKDAQKEASDDKEALQQEILLLKESNEKEVSKLKGELQKMEESHKAYLGKIGGVLEKTHAQREIETKRVSRELELLKRQKDSQIKALKVEVKKLRMLHESQSSPPKLPTLSRTHLLRKRLERTSDARARRSGQFEDVVQTITSLLSARMKESIKNDEAGDKTVTMGQDTASNITDMVDMLGDLFRMEEESRSEQDVLSLDLIDDYMAQVEPNKAVNQMRNQLNYAMSEYDAVRAELEKRRVCPACAGLNKKKQGKAIIYDADPTIYG